MYYESIKVLDCTIRDGGLVNKHDFSLEFVRRLYTLLTAAGIDYMEMGYKNSPELFDPKEYGPWKFCDDDLLWKVKDGIDSKMKMAVMADVGRVNMDAVKPASESPYQMFRVASYVKNIDKGISMVNAFHDMGYETTLNIMAVSRDRGPELDEALHQVNEECHADVLYLVDSFGAFYQEDIDKELNRYKGIVKGKKFGFHGHNNQQLAFSNTIQDARHIDREYAALQAHIHRRDRCDLLLRDRHRRHDRHSFFVVASRKSHQEPSAMRQPLFVPAPHLPRFHQRIKANSSDTVVRPGNSRTVLVLAGNAVRDTSLESRIVIRLAVILLGNLLAKAVHHARGIRVLAQNPVKLVGRVLVHRLGAIQVQGVKGVNGSCGKACQAGVFTLPPVVTLVVVRNEECQAHSGTSLPRPNASLHFSP